MLIISPYIGLTLPQLCRFIPQFALPPRAGPELTAKAFPDRLATGAVVEEPCNVIRVCNAIPQWYARIIMTFQSWYIIFCFHTSTVCLINGSCYPNSLDFTSSSSSINHKRNRSWSELNKFSLHELVLRSERWTSYRRVVPVTGPMLGGTNPWSQLMRSCPGAVVLWNVELFQCSNVHIIPVVMSQHLDETWQ